MAVSDRTPDKLKHRYEQPWDRPVEVAERLVTLIAGMEARYAAATIVITDQRREIAMWRDLAQTLLRDLVPGMSTNEMIDALQGALNWSPDKNL